MDIGRIIEVGEVTVRRPESSPANPEQQPKEAPASVPAGPAGPRELAPARSA
jgi:hypothetical protein